MDKSVIIKAIKHPSNYKPIIFCSISMIAVGMLMVVLGIIMLIIDNIELGPPISDPHYERYEGSSLANVMGPMFLAFGTVTIFGNIILLAYSSRSYYLLLVNFENNRHIISPSAIP